MSVSPLSGDSKPLPNADLAEILVRRSFLEAERKEHGMRRWIEGCAPPGSRVAVVDDVVTSGKSVLRAIAACREGGFEVVQVVVLVDREEGGMAAVREAAGKAPASAIFTRSQLEALR